MESVNFGWNIGNTIMIGVLIAAVTINFKHDRITNTDDPRVSALMVQVQEIIDIDEKQTNVLEAHSDELTAHMEFFKRIIKILEDTTQQEKEMLP